MRLPDNGHPPPVVNLIAQYTMFELLSAGWPGVVSRVSLAIERRPLTVVWAPFAHAIAAPPGQERESKPTANGTSGRGGCRS